MIKLVYILIFLLFYSVLQSSVNAGMIDKEGVEPWEVCALCHSLNGISRMAKFPKLAGQKASYIEKQLRDFKSGVRENDGGQMNAIVTEITEQEFPIVADYFAKLSPPEPVDIKLTSEEKKRAELLFEKGDKNITACVTCHVIENKAYPLAPALTAQHPTYLVKQLSDFKDGNRNNDKDGVMSKLVTHLSNNDIEILAKYISSLAR